MDVYAREELRHGRSCNPELVTQIRSSGRLEAHPEGFAPLDAANAVLVVSPLGARGDDRSHGYFSVD